MIILTPLISAIGPLLLWPIELFLPYPFIVEEVFKGIIVYLILQVSGKKLQEKFIIASAVLFSLSESLLYIFNFSLVGNGKIFLLRLLLTTIMHLCTFLIIYFSGRKNLKLLPIGVLAGAVIHFFYNYIFEQLTN